MSFKLIKSLYKIGPLSYLLITILMTTMILKNYHTDNIMIGVAIFIEISCFPATLLLFTMMTDGNPHEKEKAQYVGILSNHDTQTQSLTYFKTYLGACFSVRFQWWSLCHFTNEKVKNITYDVRQYSYHTYPNLILNRM